MGKLNIAVTGYFGTGSSAVIDLLREYKCVRLVPEIGRAYEHEIFYYPGGLFDLCSLLTNGNTPQGSDIYINNFINTMHRLNDYDYGWYGSYQKLFGNKVMQIADKFVATISERREGTNSYHTIKTRMSLVKAVLQLAAHIVYKRKIAQYGVKYIKDNNPVYFAMPSEEELYKAAQEFTSSYFNLFAVDGTISIYDHLIWPQQINAQQRCFTDNLKIIVVNRDPRDVFLSSKYVWCKPQTGGSSIGKPHFGDDPLKFSAEWKKTVVTDNSNPNALLINFEDLIYQYEKTVKEIENFVGLSSQEHISPKTKFDPEKSIENTQVFNANNLWKSESRIIADELPEYIYNFPFQKETKLSKMFDNKFEK